MVDLQKGLVICAMFIGIASGWVMSAGLWIASFTIFLASWFYPLPAEARFYLLCLLGVASISLRLDVLIAFKLAEKE